MLGLRGGRAERARGADPRIAGGTREARAARMVAATQSDPLVAAPRGVEAPATRGRLSRGQATGAGMSSAGDGEDFIQGGHGGAHKVYTTGDGLLERKPGAPGDNHIRDQIADRDPPT